MAMSSALRSTTVLYLSLLSSLFFTTFAANTTIPSSSFVADPGNDNVSLSVNVPSGAGQNDLYFHFEAPSKDHQWAGFGVGSGMSGSLIFVVYKPQNNQGLPIVSTRIGFGHAMPQYTNDANVTVLPGSIATDEVFMVDFHCVGCRNWSGGNINIDSKNQDFFFALGPNNALESNDPNVAISQHTMIPVIFSLNLQEATGQGGVPTIGSSGDHEQEENLVGLVNWGPLLAVHALAMGLVFIVIFPLGYLFLRLFEKVWLHATFQSIGLIVLLVGAAAGIAASKTQDISPDLTHPHQIVGLVVVGLAMTTWLMGLIGHRLYKKRGVSNGFMKTHRFIGPTMILVAYVNACIGFVWIGAPLGIAFFLGFGAVVWIVVGILVFFKKRHAHRKRATETVAARNFREAELYDTPSDKARHPEGVHGYQGLPMQNMDTEYRNGHD